MRALPKSNIEYLSHHWPVVTGCSFGCPWCWARSMAKRFPHAMHPEEFNWPLPFHVPVTHPDRLDLPLRRKKPARIGVCFTGDLFGLEVPERFQLDAFKVMICAPQHRFLVLTKRAEGMRRFMEEWCSALDFPRGERQRDHVWIGVSVTNQQEADERIPLLLQTPAARRWVSIEPCFSALDLSAYMGVVPNITGERAIKFSMLHWVVVGSIDRPSAECPAPRREWIDAIVKQCRAAGVPVWVKNNTQPSTAARLAGIKPWPQEVA